MQENELVLQENENLLNKWFANMTVSSMRAAGGKLFLTNQRLVFVPTAVDHQLGVNMWDIKLTEIKSLDKAAREWFGFFQWSAENPFRSNYKQ